MIFYTEMDRGALCCKVKSGTTKERGKKWKLQKEGWMEPYVAPLELPLTVTTKNMNLMIIV